MTLKLYNTLTRTKDEFKPINKNSVGVYVCGPTVYGHAHLGHAKSYISFDILIRYLRYLGYSVTYVQNITDVGHLTDNADEGEDKIEKEAKKEKKHPMAIAEYYTKSYFDDMDKLNCTRPDISPRATGHITEQIDLVKKLLEKGYAYEANGSVYFDISKFKDYGKLAGRNVEEMRSQACAKVSSDKKNPIDFALWKKAEKNHIMQWPSPWGMGYPGWHLECSVMSTKYLGQPFDIHGGGLENQFPHHDCEIAQAEAAEQKQFVNFWLHNNMVTVEGQKMGKSLNNFINLKQLFAGSHQKLTRKYSPLAVRQLVLNSHYRSPLDFSDAALYAAQSGHEKINETVKNLKTQIETAPEGDIDKKTDKNLEEIKNKYEDAMNNDLNTAVALSAVFDLTRLTAELLKEKATQNTLKKIDDLFTQLASNVLGIIQEDYSQTSDTDEKTLNDVVEILIEQRKNAREQNNFKTADDIRNKLSKIGIILEDKPDGTKWRKQ